MEQVKKPQVRSMRTFVSGTPFDEARVGAAAVYCSDGRFGEQMDEFLHAGLGLPRYDRVACPGGACMAGHLMVYHEKNAMEQQLSFLIKNHELRRVVLIAHENCGFYKGLWTGGNTVEQQQAADLAKAAELISSWNLGVEVETYFARKVDGHVAIERWPKRDARMESAAHETSVHRRPPPVPIPRGR